MVQAIKAHEFTEKTDVWAWGVFGWELTTNCEFPYADLPDDLAVVKGVRAGLRLPRNKGVSDDVWAVLTGCWAAGAGARPSFSQLVARLGMADAGGGDYLQDGSGSDAVYAALSELDSSDKVCCVRLPVWGCLCLWLWAPLSRRLPTCLPLTVFLSS